MENAWYGTTEALELVAKNAPAPVTLPTLIAWCVKYEIGRKIGGRWWVNHDKLMALIKGQQCQSEEGKK